MEGHGQRTRHGVFPECKEPHTQRHTRQQTPGEHHHQRPDSGTPQKTKHGRPNMQSKLAPTLTRLSTGDTMERNRTAVRDECGDHQGHRLVVQEHPPQGHVPEGQERSSAHMLSMRFQRARRLEPLLEVPHILPCVEQAALHSQRRTQRNRTSTR